MHHELRRRVEQGRARGQDDASQPAPTAASALWRDNVGRAADYLTLLDLELRIVFNNRRQPGVPTAEGALAMDYLDPACHALFLDTAASAYLSGMPQSFETLGTGPDGETVAYRSWVVALLGSELHERTGVGSGSGLLAVISVDLSHVGRVERELAAQTGVLESLARHAPDNIMVLDREQRILFANHLLDPYEPNKVLGQPAWSFLPQQYQQLARAQQQKVVQTGEATSYEVPLELPSGMRWYNTRAGPVMSNGSVERILLISTDVTEARRHEAEAARERAALDLLERVDRCILAATELAPMIDSVLEVIRDGLSAARVALSCPCLPEASSWSIGYECRATDAPALLGQPLGITPDFRAHIEAALASTGVCAFGPKDAANEPLWAHGVRGVWSMTLRPSSGPAWLLSLHRSAAEPLTRADRTLLENLGRRLADGLKSLLALRELRQSEERFRTLVEHAPEALVILDVDLDRFVDANANAEKMFALSRAQLFELSPLSLAPEFQPDGRRSDAVIREVLKATLRGEIPTFEWLHIDANQQRVFCEVRLVQLPHPDKRLVRGSFTDIGERKRAEEEHRVMAAQLSQAQKMQALGQLTGGIAHDFNNLLTVIIGSLAMLEMDGIDPTLAREMVQHADTAAQRAAALTQRLLAFSRRQPLRPQSIDPKQLLPGMELLLRRTLPESIAVDVVVERYTWCCEADPVQLESAVLNLAINARDAMPRGGTLHITAHNAHVDAGSALAAEGLAPGDYVQIAVKDSGTGMTRDVLAQAFEPFFTTKGVGRGSGLGLSMVYGFAKQSGGHVGIVSEPNQGTEVQLHLPRAQRSASAPGLPPVSVPNAGSGQLLLVVEDDPGVRQLVCEMLRRLGYQTVAAEDGPSALKLLNGRTDVALMLTDMALPGGMGGAELVGQVRAKHPTLPVLFMTGYSKDAVANDQPGTQDVQLLAKPFTKAALAAAVREALRGR